MMTQNKNIPALRFPEFSGYWNAKKLGEYLTFKNGINADKSQYGQGQKFINVLDIINNNGITHDLIIGRVSVSENEFKKNEVKYGDILFQRSSETREEVGQSNVYLDKAQTATFGGFVIRGQAIQEYNPLFFHYLLKTSAAREEITTKSGGSTRYNIGQDTLKEVKISLPTLPEQQKIAAFLTAVNEKIQQLTKKKDLLEQYKKGVMQQIFNQEIRFKDDNGNDFADWELMELKEIAVRVSAKNKSNKIKKVLTNSATKGIVSQQDYFDKDIANQNNLEGYYIVEKDDFVYNPRISASAPVGPIKRNKLERGLMSPLYSVFRFMEVDLDFIEQFFETKLWHDYLKSIANYGARHDRMNITVEGFFDMPILLPSQPEQEKITNFLSAIDDKIDLVNQQLEKTQTFKKGLLQQMFV